MIQSHLYSHRSLIGALTVALTLILSWGLRPAIGHCQTAPEAPPGVDLSKLSAEQKESFFRIAEEQFCPCGNAQSFLDSLGKPESCKAATGLGNYLAGKLADGKSRRSATRSLLRRVANLNARFKLDTAKSPRLGGPKAPIEIVVFSDFECPYCRRVAKPLTDLVAENKDVALIYKCFPLDFHENAKQAAVAALAAQKQGKFWPMHDAIYESDDPPTDEILSKLAKKAGLDVKKWKEALRDGTIAAQIEADIAEGNRAEVQGTPSFFVNGLTAADIDDVIAKVKEERAAQR